MTSSNPNPNPRNEHSQDLPADSEEGTSVEAWLEEEEAGSYLYIAIAFWF